MDEETADWVVFDLPWPLLAEVRLWSLEHGYEEGRTVGMCFDFATLLHTMWSRGGGVRIDGSLQDPDYDVARLRADDLAYCEVTGGSASLSLIDGLMQDRGWSRTEAAAWIMTKGFWLARLTVQGSLVVFEPYRRRAFTVPVAPPDFVPPLWREEP